MYMYLCSPLPPGGPYAIFDAASGQLLLDAALLRDTWGWGRGSYGQPGSGPAVHRPEVPYIAGQLGQRLFKQLADMVAAAAAAGNGKSSSGDGGGGIADGGGLHGGMYDGLYDSEDLAAVLAAAGGGSEVRVLLIDTGVATCREVVTCVVVSRAAQQRHGFGLDRSQTGKFVVPHGCPRPVHPLLVLPLAPNRRLAPRPPPLLAL